MRLELQRKWMDLVVMDCIGYNIGMKEQFKNYLKTGDFVPDTCSPGYDGTAVIRGEMRWNWRKLEKYFNKLHECQTGECADK